MGHSKIQTTFDTYGHLMPGSRDEVRERMDAYLVATGPLSWRRTPIRVLVMQDTSRRTSDELSADSQHVLYEARQLDDVVRALAGSELTPPEQGEQPVWASNALLENVGLHARALILFLYDKPKKSYPDDVLALDYVCEWPSVRPAESDFLREVRERVGAEMAHITRRRTTLAEALRAWSYGKVHVAVAEVLREFILLVPEDLVQPGWRGDIWRTLPGHVRGQKHFSDPPPPGGGSPTAKIGLSGTAESLQAAARATRMWRPGE